MVGIRPHIDNFIKYIEVLLKQATKYSFFGRDMSTHHIDILIFHALFSKIV